MADQTGGGRSRATAEDQAQAQSALRMIKLVFLINSMGLALWFPRIPEVKAALDLDLFILSLCFFAMPVGVILGFFLAPPIVARLGLRRACTWGNAAFLVSFVGPALAWNAPTLAGTLFFAGLIVATIEVAMNAKASQIETTLGRRIMSRCHGFWSIGSMLGALVAGGCAHLGIDFRTQQVIAEPLLALAAIWAGLRLDADAPQEEDLSHGFTLPTRALAALCMLPLGALLIEGAMMEWSAILTRETLLASPLMTSICFATFAMAMAIGRLSGDWITDMFGPLRVLVASALFAAVGILAFGLSNGIPMALAASVLVGFGISNIYPITMSLAAVMPGQRAEKNVAAVAFCAFSVFLFGPPFIGTTAHLIGLPFALALLTPFGLIPLALVMSGKVQPHPTPAQEA
ncbi:MFS transporter [Oceanomicrobium pacificus]|uniref:Major facilitator superfamily (MFS) profile domain-containing protein n=1 Tax=Oceanomicrobium pacificus TaxID=2692916 RepID=A0A6B0TLZ0_9RHOB|nr:MFS transporter [Oceanomicrobium pacificus]MXU64916.1 hypothetical protein [Oceanomicrobium pacificus]